ncbi:porin [uncultured Rhodospira sp.]|uniref:porin n=1 Tax=uncultured Rhodospira sp. TaxID=1936189 RepID=UPI0026254847|nr:porin [uncultured Rhodospira sp.]
MKKVLFGTTALIAAAAFAGTAHAEKIKLSIGGKQEVFFGAGDVNDEGGETWASTGMATDTELYFTGSTTLDNGITVKAIIQLEAEDNGDRNADEQAIQMSGGFGALQLGQRQGYVGQMQFNATDAGGVIGWDEYWGWTEFAVGHVEPYYTSDDLSVSYVTPSFFGFSLATEYAPDNAGNDDSGFEDWNNTGSSYKDLFGIGAAFDNEFSGVGIHADFTYQHQFGVGAVNDRALIRGGAAVSYMGFELGGAYGVWAVDGDDNDMEHWTVSASYANGPYGVAFVYGDSHIDAGANDVDSQSFMFSGNYVLGPGIDLGAAVFHGNEDTPAGVADRETTGVLFGVGLSF